MFMVVLALACPNLADTVLTSTLSAINNVAWVCLSLCMQNSQYEKIKRMKITYSIILKIKLKQIYKN